MQQPGQSALLCVALCQVPLGACRHRSLIFWKHTVLWWQQIHLLWKQNYSVFGTSNSFEKCWVCPKANRWTRAQNKGSAQTSPCPAIACLYPCLWNEGNVCPASTCPLMRLPAAPVIDEVSKCCWIEIASSLDKNHLAATSHWTKVGRFCPYGVQDAIQYCLSWKG